MPRHWTDPVSGIQIPTALKPNLAYRHALLTKAEQDRDVQQSLIQMSAASLGFWVRTFAWTFRQMEVGEGGKIIQVRGTSARRPFIPWQRQDQVFAELQGAIEEGHDLMIDKSRNQGATWMCLLTFLWYWLFDLNCTFLIVSRKEEEVDKRGNRKSLFWKLDYALQNLPKWMLPVFIRTHMHLEAVERENIIDGESTNADVGRGDRRTALMGDEFGAVDDGFAIWAGTADTTNCRIWNSTPYGPGTCFTHLHHQSLRTGHPKRVELGWWDNPEQAQGLCWKKNKDGVPKRSSPWYEADCKRRDAKDVAQNLDIDHGRSGDIFFDADVIARQMMMYAMPGRDTMQTGILRYDDKPHFGIMDRRLSSMDGDRLGFEDDTDGPWQIWCPLVEHDRPRQNTRYALGADIGKGLGASNSTITAIDCETGRKVGAFASAVFKPYEFARIMVMAAIWFGGADLQPLIAWEANGPGGEFGDEIIKLTYGRVWYMRPTGIVSVKITEKYGWHSNPGRKRTVFGMLRKAMERDEFINMSVDALEEAGEIIEYERGGIGPARMREDSETARATHGDRVTADAVAWMASLDEPKFRAGDRQIVPGSPMWRREQRRRRAHQQARDYLGG